MNLVYFRLFTSSRQITPIPISGRLSATAQQLSFGRLDDMAHRGEIADDSVDAPTAVASVESVAASQPAATWPTAPPAFDQADVAAPTLAERVAYIRHMGAEAYLREQLDE